MDKNEITGSIKEVKSASRWAIGRAVGDAKLQGHSQADEAVDRSQNYTSGLNDAVRYTKAMKSAGLLAASPINTGPCGGVAGSRRRFGAGCGPTRE
jgi:hypothetical protein